MKKRRIKFGELKIGDWADEYWQRIKETNWVSMGPLVEEFEGKFAKLFGAKHAVAVSSGTDADICSLLTLYETHDARRGDEIIVPALAFFSVASSVIAAGFKPVFVEIDPYTLNINPYLIEGKITKRTRAILAVNTMGKPVDIPILQYITKKHRIALIIDNCEGHGCRYNGKFMEEYAPIVNYSCYQAHLVQSVEYGFCCTNDDKMADLLRCIRTHGREGGKNSFNHLYLGYNSKPSDLHSIIGLSQINEFWERFHKRKNNVAHIRSGLTNYEKFMMFSEQDENCVNSPHAFSIVLTDEKYKIENFKRHLTNYLVDWKLNFKCIPHNQPGIAKFVKRNNFSDEYQMSKWAGDLGIHFGCHEHLTSDDCEYIVWVIRKYFDEERYICQKGLQ